MTESQDVHTDVRFAHRRLTKATFMRAQRCVLVLTTAGGLLATVGAGSAMAGVPLASGQLTGADNQPSAGTVRVFNLPRDGQTQPQLLGESTADPAGQWAVSALDDASLRQYAAANGGSTIDLVASGGTTGSSGSRVFSMNVNDVDGSVRVAPANSVQVPPASSTSRQAALPAAGVGGSSAARVQLRANQKFPTTGRAAAPGPICTPVYITRNAESRRSSVVVGELNNAYNDGTVATFEYARSGSASTSIGVAQSFDNGASFSIADETYVDAKGTVKFQPATRRLARKLRTAFEFTRQEVKDSSCAKFKIQIRATSFIGGTNVAMKQPGALDRCQTEHAPKFDSKTEFLAEKAKGTRFMRGATAFGVNLTSKTDFSTNVSLRHTFGGPPLKRHYLCGPDGKQSPYDAGRVFSGSRK